MGREEQIEEREVLDSIFPDEITGLPHPGFSTGEFKTDSSDAQTYPRQNTGYQSHWTSLAKRRRKSHRS
jgi:hypothetical protein